MNAGAALAASASISIKIHPGGGGTLGGGGEEKKRVG